MNYCKSTIRFGATWIPAFVCVCVCVSGVDASPIFLKMIDSPKCISICGIDREEASAEILRLSELLDQLDTKNRGLTETMANMKQNQHSGDSGFQPGPTLAPLAMNTSSSHHSRSDRIEAGNQASKSQPLFVNLVVCIYWRIARSRGERCAINL
jgi:hypothetical protein